MPPRGFEATFAPDVNVAAASLLAILYSVPYPRPVSKSVYKVDRNSEIGSLYNSGWSVPKLAREYRISKVRVYQVLKHVLLQRNHTGQTYTTLIAS